MFAWAPALAIRIIISSAKQKREVPMELEWQFSLEESMNCEMATNHALKKESISTETSLQIFRV